MSFNTLESRLGAASVHDDEVVSSHPVNATHRGEQGIGVQVGSVYGVGGGRASSNTRQDGIAMGIDHPAVTPIAAFNGAQIPGEAASIRQNYKQVNIAFCIHQSINPIGPWRSIHPLPPHIALR